MSKCAHTAVTGRRNGPVRAQSRRVSHPEMFPLPSFLPIFLWKGFADTAAGILVAQKHVTHPPTHPSTHPPCGPNRKRSPAGAAGCGCGHRICPPTPRPLAETRLALRRTEKANEDGRRVSIHGKRDWSATAVMSWLRVAPGNAPNGRPCTLCSYSLPANVCRECTHLKRATTSQQAGR